MIQNFVLTKMQIFKINLFFISDQKKPIIKEILTQISYRKDTVLLYFKMGHTIKVNSEMDKPMMTKLSLYFQMVLITEDKSKIRL